MPGKALAQSCAKYLWIFQVSPQSYDFSMYMAAGRNVLNVIIRWVTWNSASRSSWIVTDSSPLTACHHVLWQMSSNKRNMHNVHNEKCRLTCIVACGWHQAVPFCRQCSRSCVMFLDCFGLLHWWNRTRSIFDPSSSNPNERGCSSALSFVNHKSKRHLTYPGDQWVNSQ